MPSGCARPADHALTLARHPSETDERMMLRIAAFALNADQAMEFGKGLSDEDEPGLWQKSLTGTIESWIEVGLPDAKRLRKACGRARDVCVYAYGRGAGIWWRQTGEDLARHENLAVWTIAIEASQALAALTARNMKLLSPIEEGVGFVSDEPRSVQIEPQLLKRRGE